MATKLFVGSLSYNVDDTQLRDFFAAIGEVTSANVITDRDSGQSKGFGFVEMSSDTDAQEAIKQLNGKDLDGRSIIVPIEAGQIITPAVATAITAVTKPN
jgi:cold-inducible RNA-binding protein